MTATADLGTEAAIDAALSAERPPNRIRDLLTLRMWQEEHGGQFFPSIDAIEWWLRTHAKEMASCDAYIVNPRGRFVDPKPFGEAVRTIIEAESRAAKSALAEAKTPPSKTVRRSSFRSS